MHKHPSKSKHAHWGSTSTKMRTERGRLYLLSFAQTRWFSSRQKSTVLLYFVKRQATIPWRFTPTATLTLARTITILHALTFTDEDAEGRIERRTSTVSIRCTRKVKRVWCQHYDAFVESNNAAKQLLHILYVHKCCISV